VIPYGLPMHVPTLIEHKREGGAFSAEQINFLIAGLTDGSIPEYQWSALAMAIYFRGMTAEETWLLTRAMRDSGTVIQYPAGHPTIVDKHSTGGVGDKVSLILAPLLACDGLWVPMISGRGLGITGGTLDKLESIPGFNTRLAEADLIPQLQKIGVFMAGQTDRLCPADRKLYSLRDVTGTVPSQPLIVASIMSKKLAENLDRLVLDVKFGSGAFMKTRTDAQSLADAMAAVAKLAGVEFTAQLNPMDEPLGHAVGNALEVHECLEIMRGRGPTDLEELTLTLAQALTKTPRAKLQSWLRDGTAYAKFQQLVSAHGGNPADLETLVSQIHCAPRIMDVLAASSGTLSRFDALSVGRACVALGGGRAKATDAIDFAVGFDSIAKCGQVMTKGDRLCRVHARSEQAALEAQQQILAAVTIS
jgi:pyrimidine-nucleoside phosphorylase